MNINTQEDIIFYTARECNLTEAQVKLIEKNFWQTIRNYLTDPLNSINGILISGFFKIFIPTYKINQLVEKSDKEIYKELWQKINQPN